MLNPTLLNALGYTSPFLKYIVDLAIGDTKDNVASNKNLTTLELDAKKQELNIALAEAQARVAQELAIARRIEVAEQVEIEEFYDLNGDANLGVQGKGKAIALGLTASGQRVSKRIYKFTGVNSTLSEITSEQEQTLLTQK
ncbi:hypothetical protein [Aggregatibacter sp.]